MALATARVQFGQFGLARTAATRRFTLCQEMPSSQAT